MGTVFIDEFGRRHHGLVTLDAFRQAGVGRSTWYRACSDGRIELLHPGVARLHGTRRTKVQAIAAAVLAAGPGAMASHRSCLALWGVERPDDDPVDIITAERSQHRRLSGVVVHRPRDRLDLRTMWRRGIATVPLLRGLTDIGAVDPAGAVPAVGHVLTTGLADLSAIWWAIEQHSRKGRPGVRALREALAEWIVDGKPLDSDLERLMNKVARKYCLPAMQFHRWICGYEVDFWVVGTPIVLECDGFDAHAMRKQRFEHDRRRRAELTAAGYVVVNFTWRQLTRQPKWVVAKINENVARWGHLDEPK